MSDTELSGPPGEAPGPEISSGLEQQILSQWDRADARAQFPRFSTQRVWAFGRGRLSAFRTAGEWLTVVELLAYLMGLGDFAVAVYAYGSHIRNMGLQDPSRAGQQDGSARSPSFVRRIARALGLAARPPADQGVARLLAQFGLRVPSGRPELARSGEVQDDWWCADPYHVQVVLGGAPRIFQLTPGDYLKAGIDLEGQVSGNSQLDRIIHVFRLLCAIIPGDQLFYPDPVLLRYVGRPYALPLFLRLEEWCTPGVGGIDRPSSSPCLRSLARALALSRPGIYTCSPELVNTHWSQWPGWIDGAR